MAFQAEPVGSNQLPQDWAAACTPPAVVDLDCNTAGSSAVPVGRPWEEAAAAAAET